MGKLKDSKTLYEKVQSTLEKVQVQGLEKGLVTFILLGSKDQQERWYLLISDDLPLLSTTPPKELDQEYKKLSLTLTKKDLYTLMLGGLSGVQGMLSSRLKVEGDLAYGQVLESKLTPQLKGNFPPFKVKQKL